MVLAHVRVYGRTLFVGRGSRDKVIVGEHGCHVLSLGWFPEREAPDAGSAALDKKLHVLGVGPPWVGAIHCDCSGHHRSAGEREAQLRYSSRLHKSADLALKSET